MQVGMIGAGSVGQTLGAALISAGHRVMIGVREPGSEALAKDRGYAGTLGAWVERTGGSVGSFAEAAAFGEAVFNATQGQASLTALSPATDGLIDKVLVDVANPLDFSAGMPPFLNPAYSGPTSLAEEIQKAHPKAKVVKAFNTIAAPVMVNAALIPGDHDLFIAGHSDGKEFVIGLAKAWGWKHIIDLGDLKGARATESLLPIWVQLWQTLGTLNVNLHVARG
jgi:8-hydroxy-5-deazaflavin:NADPH oxidoreductase